MERAKALLAKRAESAKVGVGNVTIREGEILLKEKKSATPEKTSRPILETDIAGSEDNGAVNLRERKRARESVDGISRSVLSKSTSGTGVEVIPPFQTSKDLSAIRVEVSPHQRWTAGADAPVQVFQVFDLPQDTNSYVNKTNVEIAERCLTRGGRFLADLTHIVNAYKSGGGTPEANRLIRELTEARSRISEMEKRVAESEKRAVESERRETEAAKKSFEAKGKLSEEIKTLKDKMTFMGEDLKRSQAAVGDEQKRNKVLELEVSQGRDEITKLRGEVEKGVEDLVDALGVGYKSCYDRVVAAGIDLTGHSFDDYCASLAKGAAEEAGGGSGEVAAAQT